ncbi:MAG TPA: ABC transporter substrate-binding protein [Pirellulaceae bacterium]|jgi:ABC-type transport system substrate-binding protein|nr:ABC transporter substrate-binding protein [Pirellulaceae bacterium]
MTIARPFVSLSLSSAFALGIALSMAGCSPDIEPAPTVVTATDAPDVIDVEAAEVAATAPIEAASAETASTETASAETGASEVAATEATAETATPEEAAPAEPPPALKTELVETAASATPGGPPPKNDVLNLYYGDDPDRLNPVLASDSVSSSWIRRVAEPLARRKFSDPSTFEPVLAESWTFDEENLEYTINLRKGVYWHPAKLPNGKVIPPEEFTSRDVKFTYDTILNENTEAASMRSYFLDPEATDPKDRYKIRVTPVSKYVVKIKWSKPYFMMDDWSLGNPEFNIIPRHIYSVDKNGKLISLDFSSKEFATAFNDHWANDEIIGTGPYRLVEWRQGDRVLMKRNEDYWGEKPHFSEIYERMISNPETSVQLALDGDLDLAAVPEISRYVRIRDEPGGHDPDVVRPVEIERTAYRYLGYNLQKPIFQDPKVRMALSHAVPVDQIIDSIYHGLAVRMTGPFVPGKFSADVEPIPYDLDKARQLLKEAGWEDTDNNGIVDKELGGRKTQLAFDIMIFADSPQYSNIALTIRDSFQRIGVKVDATPTKWQLMLEKLNKKEFDATILGWVADWKSDPFQLWHSSQADLPDSSNFGYKNPKVDELIDKLRVTLDEEDQVPLYQEIHREIYKDQPYTFLYKEKATGLLNARIENFKTYPELRPHYDFLEWTSSKARVQK